MLKKKLSCKLIKINKSEINFTKLVTVISMTRYNNLYLYAISGERVVNQGDK